MIRIAPVCGGVRAIADKSYAAYWKHERSAIFNPFGAPPLSHSRVALAKFRLWIKFCLGNWPGISTHRDFEKTLRDWPFEILFRWYRARELETAAVSTTRLSGPKGLTVSIRAATSCIVSSTHSPDSHITDPRRLSFRGTTRYRNLPRVHFHIHDCTVTFLRRPRWRSQRHYDVPSGFLNR